MCLSCLLCRSRGVLLVLRCRSSCPLCLCFVEMCVTRSVLQSGIPCMRRSRHEDRDLCDDFSGLDGATLHGPGGAERHRVVAFYMLRCARQLRHSGAHNTVLGNQAARVELQSCTSFHDEAVGKDVQSLSLIRSGREQFPGMSAERWYQMTQWCKYLTCTAALC